MDAVDARSRLLADLAASLCRDPDVEFAATFGSQVTGEPRPSSDLDLAVKFTADLSSHERFRKRCFLSDDLQRADAPFVDVSDVEALPIDVAHDAVNGEFLCGDERAFSQFSAAVEVKFEERRDEIRRHQRGVIDRIAEGHHRRSVAYIGKSASRPSPASTQHLDLQTGAVRASVYYPPLEYSLIGKIW